MAYGPATLDPTRVMGRRIAAWFIDFLPAVILVGIFARHNAVTYTNVGPGFCTTFRASHSGYWCLPSGGTAYTSPGFRGATIVVWLVYYFAIAGVLQGATGATLGKRVLGLRVVDQNGALCTMGQAFLRTLVGVFEIGFCFVIGLVSASVTHPHRRLGDLAAGTFVVSKEAVGRPIAGAASSSPYPPPWTPPGGPVGWGPPPAGAPGDAPAPGWGSPPAQSPGTTPTPTAAPTWGTPVLGPPPAQTPTTWGAPVADDPPAPGPVPQPATQAPAAREPQWDAPRNAWVFWEVETGRWLQHDPVTGQWGPLR